MSELLAAIIAIPGALAILHLVGLFMKRPLVCLARVQGNSMLPTLNDGDWVLFMRLPLRVGRIVYADPGDLSRVVKRVTDRRDYKKFYIFRLEGDNRAQSAVYTVYPREILGVMVCRLWGAG